jgi:peroxiredoxin
VLILADPFVMREWAATHKNQDRILMLADGDVVFHRASGLTQKLPYCGERGRRFSLYADDGVVKIINVENPGALDYKVSGPEHMLQDLKNLNK